MNPKEVDGSLVFAAMTSFAIVPLAVKSMIPPEKTFNSLLLFSVLCALSPQPPAEAGNCDGSYCKGSPTRYAHTVAPAAQSLKLALAGANQDPAANYQLADSYMKLNRWTEASVLLENALTMEPSEDLVKLIHAELTRCASAREGGITIVEGREMGISFPTDLMF